MVVCICGRMAYLHALRVEGLASAARVRHAPSCLSAGRLEPHHPRHRRLSPGIRGGHRGRSPPGDGGRWPRAAERGRLVPTLHTPHIGLLVQGGWAVVLTLSGTYGQLLDYVVFGDWRLFGLDGDTLPIPCARPAQAGARLGAAHLSRPLLPRAAGVNVITRRIRGGEQRSLEPGERADRCGADRAGHLRVGLAWKTASFTIGGPSVAILVTVRTLRRLTRYPLRERAEECARSLSVGQVSDMNFDGLLRSGRRTRASRGSTRCREAVYKLVAVLQRRAGWSAPWWRPSAAGSGAPSGDSARAVTAAELRRDHPHG